MAERIKINVSGRLFEISRSMLKKHPDSTLSKMVQSGSTSDELLFFERPASIFEAILTFYQTDQLHMPCSVCPLTFKNELEFWGISPYRLETCCRRTFVKFSVEQEKMLKFEKFTSPARSEKQGTGTWAEIKYRVWTITDFPFTCVAAKVYFAIASLLVVTSTFLVVMTTHPLFQRALTQNEWRQYWADDWEHHSEQVNQYLKINDDQEDVADVNSTLDEEELEELKAPTAKYDSIRYTTYFCTAFFTTELCVRLVVCPSIRAFFKSFLNVVDTLAVVVSIVEVVANYVVSTELYETTYVDILSCFQILRVLRLYRLTSHITGARVLSYAVRISVNELIFMALLLTINTVIFGTVAYYADQSNMKDILRACWWAVITMTTVGYGDIVPSTATGKLVGVMCAALGIMVIAITVPLFVNNFLTYYVYADLETEVPRDANNKQSKKDSVSDNKIHQNAAGKVSDASVTLVTEC